jgi:hypothetical protein
MAHETIFQDSLSRNLEDLFFIKEDQKLIEKLRTMKKLQETKEELSKVSGIKNDKVLQKLVDLNIRPETLASLTIVPLIEVAWADGTVDDKERTAVLKAIEHLGFAKGSTDYELAFQWMTHKPDSELLTAWIHYIEGLCEQLSDAEKIALKTDLVGHAKNIAEASGGILGLGNKISKEEAEMIAKMEKAFR